MQIPIKWNDYIPGMRGLVILRRKLPKNSRTSSVLQVSTSDIRDKSQAHGEEGNMFLCLILSPNLISAA